MDHDYQEQPGWVRLPGYDEDPPKSRSAGGSRGMGRTRDAGVRRVRRVSNWTAAALIAGVAAATGYFAHHAAPAAPARTSVTGVPGSTSAGVPGSTSAGVQKPSLSAPVVTSSGSGVTVRTGPNGQRIVSYKDN